MLAPATMVDQYFMQVEESAAEVAFEEYEYWRGEGI
jgi:hypothetical protein